MPANTAIPANTVMPANAANPRKYCYANDPDLL